MDKTQIRQMEWRLHQYYRRCKAVERLERLKLKGAGRIEQIETIIRNCSYKLDNPLMSPSYDGMPKAMSADSAIERCLMKAHDKLERELIRLTEREVLLTLTIGRIREELEVMEVLLDSLNEEQCQLVELRYGQGLTLRHIAAILSLDFTTIQYRKNNIIESLVEGYMELL